MKFTIRKAQLKDLPDIRFLMEELTGHTMKDSDMTDRFTMINESPGDELYVYEQHQKIQGVLGFRIRENIEETSRYGKVSVIVTMPSSRQNGVGRSLMEFAEKLAGEHECKGMWLVSGFGREQEAHKFYSKLGYEVTGYRFVKLF